MIITNLSMASSPVDLGWSPGIRPTLILLTTIICTSGIIGNSAVLYGSIRHNALRLEQVTRILVQSLAVFDLLSVILVYSTMLVTLCTRTWVLGRVVCFVTGRAGHIIVMNEVWLILTLTIYRTWRLTQPKGRKVPIGTQWGVAGLLLTLSIALMIYSTYKSPVIYTPTNLTCMSGDLFTMQGRILSIVLQLLPLIIIFLLNKYVQISVYLANKRSKKSTKNIRKTLVMLTAVTYIEILSLVPINIFVIMGSLAGSNEGVERVRMGIMTWYPLFSMYIISLNSCSNFFIYLCTNRRFRCFVVRLFTRKGVVSVGSETVFANSHLANSQVERPSGSASGRKFEAVSKV